MYVALKYALTQYRVVLLISYLGLTLGRPPLQVRHKTVAMATLVSNQQGDEIYIL